MRTVSVRLMADAADFSRKIRGAGSDVKSLRGEIDKANKGGDLGAVTDQATGLGLSLLGAAGMAVKFSMDFEKQMSAIKAATHGTAAEMEQLRQASLKAGADTQFSATQAAEGIEELSKAGISTADILGGGLAGALDLAAAGSLDVAEAAETTASALTQFKLQGKDVPHVADLLAAAAGKAQGSVHDMGMALNQAGLVAASTGLTIEDTTGTLAAFASAGLIGSDAGTSLKTMLQMLQAPSGKTKELMEDLGVSAYDASGHFIGITALAGQLKTQLGGLTPELRANAMAQIFGADAVRASNILYEQGAEGIQKWIDKTNDAGYAAETAAIKTDNLAGDVERLQGSLETLAIQSGGGANEGLRVLTKSANGLVDQFAQLPAGVSGTVTVLALLGGALVLGSVGWMKMRRSTADALEELRNTGPAGTKAAAGLQTTTKWAGRAAIAFAAAQVAAAGMSAAFGQNLNPQTEALAQSLGTWAQNGTKAGEATRLLGDDFEHLGYDLGTLDSGFWTGLGNGIGGVAESLSGMGDVADESLKHAKERISALDGALTQMVQNGQTEQAAQVFAKLAAEAKKSGVQVDELKKGLPQYSAALQTAGAQSAKTAGQVADVGESADDAADKVKDLEDAFDQLFGAQMSIDRANLRYVEGIKQVTKELKTGTKTLSLDSAEGRKNRTAVLDQIGTIDDLRTARIKHGVTLDDANKKYVKDIDGLRKSMRQAGFTKREINELTGSYRKIPDDVNTKVTVTGVGGVKSNLAQLLVMQKALKKGVSMSSARAIAGDEAAARDRGLFADGGWTGPGSKYQPAGVVHADEHVIQKSSRRKIENSHPGLLDHINEHGTLPGYAGGGQVWPFPTTAAMTRVPSKREVMSVVTPGGGASAPWMVNAIRQAFPGLNMISGYRPGSRTLSGNLSYHALNRAVDYPPSRALAEYAYRNWKPRLKELITPYPQFNVHNGQDHVYAGAVWNQHNFAGGNAHDHIAMANGGEIKEPVFGYGASGRSYSFGERGIETVTPGSRSAQGHGSIGSTTTIVNLYPTVAAGANLREAGRQIAEQLQSYLQGGGTIFVRGQQKL